MTAERYGRVKLSTIKRDFDKLRAAVLAHDKVATEAVGDNCERWLDLVYSLAQGERSVAAYPGPLYVK